MEQSLLRRFSLSRIGEDIALRLFHFFYDSHYKDMLLRVIKTPKNYLSKQRA